MDNISLRDICFHTLIRNQTKLGTVHLKSGRGSGRFGRRVIKFLTSFLGGFKIYNTRFGGLQIFLHKIVRI